MLLRMPDVRIEREGAVAILTIDRPQARNAIGLATMDELDAAFAGLAGGDARCAVLTGREAAEMGLVEESVPRDRFDARWRELAEQVARAPRHALEGIKRAVEAALPGTRPDLEARAVRDFARAWADPLHWEMAAELE